MKSELIRLREIVCIRHGLRPLSRHRTKQVEHGPSQTHQDALVKAEMDKEAERRGSVLEQQISEDNKEAEKAKNRVMLKKLFKCVYFLVKHKIAHTTFTSLLIDQ